MSFAFFFIEVFWTEMRQWNCSAMYTRLFSCERIKRYAKNVSDLSRNYRTPGANVVSYDISSRRATLKSPWKWFQNRQKLLTYICVKQKNGLNVVLVVLKQKIFAWLMEAYVFESFQNYSILFRGNCFYRFTSIYFVFFLLEKHAEKVIHFYEATCG